MRDLKRWMPLTRLPPVMYSFWLMELIVIPLTELIEEEGVLIELIELIEEEGVEGIEEEERKERGREALSRGSE